MTALIFYTFATLAVLSAVGTIFSVNPINSAMSLIVCLFSLVPIFLQLSGKFVGIIQILVYAGAIMVLFIFIIMLMDLKRDELPSIKLTPSRGIAYAFAFTFFVLIVFAGCGHFFRFPIDLPTSFGTVKEIGELFLTRYLFLFEAISVLLVVAMISVISLSKKEVA
jgi:NADH-quinone oxidoreductase subunit J